MGKVELLAPAGNYDALKGAIKAGADAVYLGGTLYGARAYADNFTQDEICTGIHLAHVFGRRVYLTVNTLVKERELDELYNFLLPLYEEGLDGVIVQDLGAVRYIRTHFPGLSLHASTQMTLTGSAGAAFVKKEGISRIVPARELSLAEMKHIKEKTGVEIEAFIHGAMCYCYSGQCLLSSILGGRSGNRGRCAQPCRLPYEIDEENSCYPLSMKDMCTLSMLPELIEAGIDSFKIEGRMKKPAYAAGVTAIYRKYIDLYYRDKENFHVAKEDMDTLQSLYIRSEISDGYYKRHNGREMITLCSPAYSGSDEKLLADIEKRYIEEGICRQVSARAYFKPGEAAKLSLEENGITVSCTGDIVQKALKQPLTDEKIKEQIQKSGNSLVKINQVVIESADEVFMPVRSVNELRRKAVSAFEEEIIRRNGLNYPDRKSVEPSVSRNTILKTAANDGNPCMSSVKDWHMIHVSVRTKEQLEAALGGQVGRIYLDYSLLKDEICELLSTYKKAGNDFAEIYLCTPYIVREKDRIHLENINKALKTNIFTGVMVRNLESFQLLTGQIPVENIVLDANLYIWNREALRFWEGQAAEFYLPVELNFHEWRELLSYCSEKGLKASAIIYGRLPMMVTANCLNKTRGLCGKAPQIITLKDRYEKRFPVYTDCLSCYNIIYNSVPLSLHKIFEKKLYLNGNYRLDFTTENQTETIQVIRYFKGILHNDQAPFYREYTTGHFKRGVE